MSTRDTHTPDHPDRPLAFWLKAVDRLVSREIDAAFADEPIDRRHWRILNRIDGSARVPTIYDHPELFAHLAGLGWIALDDDGWSLTEAGRAAKEHLAEKVAAVRARVAGAAPAEDLDTTLRTLEAIARELGWSEEDGMPERPHRHHREHEHDHRHDQGHGHGGRRPHPRWGRHLGAPDAPDAPEHPFRRGRMMAHRAFERGFLAGFDRGRAA